jgi:hypothetical protein
VGAGGGQDIEQEVAGAAGDAEAAAATTKGKRKKTGGGEGEEGEAPKKKRSKKAPPVERVVYSEELRRPLPLDHLGPVTKIMSWNVAGLRGVLKKVRPPGLADRSLGPTTVGVLIEWTLNCSWLYRALLTSLPMFTNHLPPSTEPCCPVKPDREGVSGRVVPPGDQAASGQGV